MSELRIGSRVAVVEVAQSLGGSLTQWSLNRTDGGWTGELIDVRSVLGRTVYEVAVLMEPSGLRYGRWKRGPELRHVLASAVVSVEPIEPEA